MTEPKRLSSVEGHVAGALLRSMRADTPSANARKKTLAALGIAGVGGVALAGAAATSASSSVGRALLFAKWSGPTVVGSSLLAVGVVRLYDAVLAEPPAPPPSVAVASQTVPDAQRSNSNHAAVPESSSAPAPSSSPSTSPPESIRPSRSPRSEPAAPAVAPLDERAIETSPTQPSAPRPVLAEEVIALDGVRAFVARREGAAALSALDDYSRRFPASRLASEATVLRMEALVLVGNSNGARQLAESFLREHPNSPLVPRVRAIVRASPDASR